jgi:hypothetical protein
VRHVRVEHGEQPGQHDRPVVGIEVQPRPQLVETAAGLRLGKCPGQLRAFEQDRHIRLDRPPRGGDADGTTGVVAEIEPYGAIDAGHPKGEWLLVGLGGEPVDNEQRVGQRLLGCGLAGAGEVLAGQLLAQR